MPSYKTSAIILRTYDFKESDKIVVLYSKEHGIIRAIAKAVKKPKSKMSGMISPLIAADIILNEGRNLHVIQQCDVIDFFKNLKTCLKKITIASYYLELLMAFGLENDPQAETYYNFLFEGLKKLENPDNEFLIELLLISFEFEMISMAGYAPLLSTCSSCGKHLSQRENIWFNKPSAYLYCDKCYNVRNSLVPLDKTSYKILLNLTNNFLSLKDIASEELVKVHDILFEYISQKSHYKLKTPKLIEMLCLS